MFEVASLAASAGRRIVTACRAAALTRRASVPLLYMDDRMLRDIGLTRADVVIEPDFIRSSDRDAPHSIDATSDSFAALANSPITNKREGEVVMTHVGSCFCGAVKLEVTGSPEGMGYCHCRSCRSWSGGPVNAFTLWKPEAVRVTAGAEHVATFQKTELQPASVLREVRRASDGQSSDHRPRRRVRRDDPDADLHSRRSRQLRRDGAADARRPAEAEGLSSRVWRVRRGRRGIAAPRAPAQR